MLTASVARTDKYLHAPERIVNQKVKWTPIFHDDIIQEMQSERGKRDCSRSAGMKRLLLFFAL